MTSRQTLGRDDARHIHAQVDEMLGSEDRLIFLMDGSRAVSYASGFGLSASQLELLAHDIERLVRAATRGRRPEKERTRGEQRRGLDIGSGQRRSGPACGDHGVVVDQRSANSRSGDHGPGNHCVGHGRVLRMASQPSAPDDR